MDGYLAPDDAKPTRLETDMPVITRRGRALAWKLNRYIGTTFEIEETCSLIARHAITYNHIQELWCDNERANNHEPTRLDWRPRKLRLEERITDLVNSLPWTRRRSVPGGLRG
jgi:hypothetical protein